MLSFFPRDVLDDILNLIESVSEGFPFYFYIKMDKYPLFHFSLTTRGLAKNDLPQTGIAQTLIFFFFFFFFFLRISVLLQPLYNPALFFMKLNNKQ